MNIFRFFHRKRESESVDCSENRVFILGDNGMIYELEVPDDTKEEPDYDEDD